MESGGGDGGGNGDVFEHAFHPNCIESKARPGSKRTKKTKGKPAACAALTHLYGDNAPVCWDCMEEGHVEQLEDGCSPRSDSLKRLRKQLNWDGQGSSWGGSTLGESSMLPEWCGPEPGLEPRYPGSASTPGDQVSEAPLLLCSP
jgi:hypothetical protein